MKKKHVELDVDYVGSQDPADQPTAKDFTAISRFIQQMKQQRAAEAAQQLLDQAAAQKEAA